MPSPIGAPRRARLEVVLATVIALLWVVVFYRVPIFSRFEQISGYSSDTRLAIFLAEHWRAVVVDGVPWRSPTMFAPVGGTLGYSDTYVLSAVTYIPLRACGFQPTAAYQLSLMLTAGAALAASTWIARRWFGLRPIVAVPLACVAMLPNSLFTQAGHTQLAAVHWIPIIALLFGWGRRAVTRTSAGLAMALSGALSGLLLLSAFYVTWFAIVALGVAAAVATLSSGPRSLPRRIRAVETKDLFHAASYLAGLSIPAAAFASLYLPVLESGRERTAGDAALFGMRPRHLFNVGDENLLWGWLHEPHLAGELGREWLVGFPPMFLITIAACSWATRRLPTEPRRSAWAARCSGAAAATGALIVAPMWFGERSLWPAAVRLVPGAEAIRAPGRMWLMAVVTGTTAIAAAVAARASTDPRRAAPARHLAAGLIALLLLEQVNADTTQRIDVRSERRLADAAATIPPACESFYAVGASSDGTPWGVHIDAMFVSMFARRPTLDGYSGFEPDGYTVQPGEAGHRSGAWAWAEEHDIEEGLCELDLSTSTWRTL